MELKAFSVIMLLTRGTLVLLILNGIESGENSRIIQESWIVLLILNGIESISS